MSEQTPAPATGTENTPPAAPSAGQTPPEGVPADAWDALGDKGKAALTSEREARAAAEKSAAELQAQLDEIAKANLSDLERAQAEAKSAQEAAATAATEALRYRLAAKHGISDEDAKFLQGDEAAMTALAERLAARDAAQANAPTFPKPDLTQGSGRDNANPGNPGTEFANFLTGQLDGR